MAEPTLRAQLHRLAEMSVPDVPWLEDRVIAAIREDRSRSKVQFRWPRPGLRLAPVAAIVLATLLVGVLLGSRLGNESSRPVGGAVPSRQAAVVAYRAVVDHDLDLVQTAFGGRQHCSSSQACLAVLLKTRNATQALLADMAANPAPDPVGADAIGARVAAQHFIEQLDLAIAALRAPDSDYLALSVSPSLSDLNLAISRIDCWPANPVVRNDLRQGYGCTA